MLCSTYRKKLRELEAQLAGERAGSMQKDARIAAMEDELSAVLALRDEQAPKPPRTWGARV